MAIKIEIVVQDVLRFSADVLALKYAQRSFGVDKAVVERLEDRVDSVRSRLPKIGDSLRLLTQDAVAAREVMFIGVPPAGKFDYNAVRDWGGTVLRKLYSDSANCSVEHLAITRHGAGFGLDEEEAFRAEIAGVLDAISEGRFPPRLSRITVVERDAHTAKRLREVLREVLPNGVVEPKPRLTGGEPPSLTFARDSLAQVGEASQAKPHVFVAMPFAAEYRDRFNFGIYAPASHAGFICERADMATFSGDVLQWVKDRITSAALLVADLTGANPNVYLELGYAWGRNIPTVLIGGCPARC